MRVCVCVCVCVGGGVGVEEAVLNAQREISSAKFSLQICMISMGNIASTIVHAFMTE